MPQTPQPAPRSSQTPAPAPKFTRRSTRSGYMD
jgi:hypothetical protein